MLVQLNYNTLSIICQYVLFILDTKKDKVASIYDSKKDTIDVENQDNDDYNDGELYEY